MTDREKVITHFNDAIEASGNGNTWRFVRVDVLEDAIKLLKERKYEPVIKTNVPHNFSNGVGWNPGRTNWYACGACNGAIDLNDKYCRHCGVEVKWEDANV